MTRRFITYVIIDGNRRISSPQTLIPPRQLNTHLALSCNGILGRRVGEGLVSLCFTAGFESLDPAAWLTCSSIGDGGDFFSRTLAGSCPLYWHWSKVRV